VSDIATPVLGVERAVRPGRPVVARQTQTGQPKPHKTMVVAGASGSFGATAGPVGKIPGRRVAVIADGRDKCAHMIAPPRFHASVDGSNRMKAGRGRCRDGKTCRPSGRQMEPFQRKILRSEDLCKSVVSLRAAPRAPRDTPGLPVPTGPEVCAGGRGAVSLQRQTFILGSHLRVRGSQLRTPPYHCRFCLPARTNWASRHHRARSISGDCLCRPR